MRFSPILPLVLFVSACESNKSGQASDQASVPKASVVDAQPSVRADIKSSVVRVRSTQQSWNAGQPWEKNPPVQRRALAAIVGPHRVLTTAEMVSDATYLELESPDGTHFAQAKVVAVDYEANLALLAPTSDDEGAIFYEGTTPLEMTESPTIGETVEILQIEENGQTILTSGVIQSIDVTSDFLPGHGFLTYLVKASMQSGASSFSLPVLHEGKLVGILTGYQAKDQICNVVSTDIVNRFVREVAGGDYHGFPGLGVATAKTEDPSFRQWLKLSDQVGGLYIHALRKGGAAEVAGVNEGDVLLAIDGHPIDRRGYYQHSTYGNLFWSHLVRGEKSTGESVILSLVRDGQPLEIMATLTREEEDSKLVPAYQFGKAPKFFVKGGLIFQELTRPLLEAFGENWESRAPLNFLDAIENPEKYEGKVDRIIFLSGSIPTPATVGYETLRNLIVHKVNGNEIKNIKGLIAAFRGNLGERHVIEFAEDDFKVYLDEATSAAVDAQLLQHGISRLSRVD